MKRFAGIGDRKEEIGYVFVSFHGLYGDYECMVMATSRAVP